MKDGDEAIPKHKEIIARKEQTMKERVEIALAAITPYLLVLLYWAVWA